MEENIIKDDDNMEENKISEQNIVPEVNNINEGESVPTEEQNKVEVITPDDSITEDAPEVNESNTEGTNGVEEVIKDAVSQQEATKNIFDIQKQIFENLNKDTEELKVKVNAIQANLDATKMYTKFFTKFTLILIFVLFVFEVILFIAK